MIQPPSFGSKTFSHPFFPFSIPIFDHLSSDPYLNPTAKLLWLRLYQLASASPSFTIDTYTATLANALGKTPSTISTELANLTRLGYLIPLGNAKANGSTCVAVRFPQRHLPELLAQPARRDKQQLSLFIDPSERHGLSCSLGAFRFIQDTKRFTLIPHTFLNDLFRHQALSSTAKLLFLVLYRHAYFHPEHQTTLSRAQLATAIARTPKTISRAIQELIEHHYIHKTPSEPRKTQPKNLTVLYIPFSQRNPTRGLGSNGTENRVKDFYTPPERLRLFVHIPPSVAHLFTRREHTSSEFSAQLEPKLPLIGKMAVSHLHPQSTTPPHPAGQDTPLPICSACACALSEPHASHGSYGTVDSHTAQKAAPTAQPLAEDLKTLASSALEELDALLPPMTPKPEVKQGEAPEDIAPEPSLQKMSLSGESERDKNRNYIDEKNKDKKINLTSNLRDLSEAERSQLFQTICRSFLQMKQTAKHSPLPPSEAILAAFEQVPSEHKRFVAHLSHELQRSYWLTEDTLEPILNAAYAQKPGETTETQEARARGKIFMQGFFSPFILEEENSEARSVYEAQQAAQVTETSQNPEETPLALTHEQAYRAAGLLKAYQIRSTASGTSLKDLLVQFLYHLATWRPTQIPYRDDAHRVEVAMWVGLKMLREGRWRAPAPVARQVSLALENEALTQKRQEMAALKVAREVA